MKLYVENLEFEPVSFRTPLKFGASVVKEVIMPVVTIRLTDGKREGVGIGAMPLGNAWAFPSAPHEESLAAMRRLVEQGNLQVDTKWPELLAKSLGTEVNGSIGDSIFEISHNLERIFLKLGERSGKTRPLPKLASLVCFSLFDIALFDAWGKMHDANTFALLREEVVGANLSRWLDDSFMSFGLDRVIQQKPVDSLPLFHLVGGLDPLTPGEVTKPVGDGLPEHLEAWIERDQLTHLKIKLQGDDPEWDFQRIVNVDRIASAKVRGESVYSLDFNEKCPSGAALVELLARLQKGQPRAFKRIAYVEQPTSRELRDRPEDKMHEAAKLKPVVIDEALTDYDAFKRARALGYSGVALKACKGIGPSLLMAAACRKDNLFLCVQDLTCPGLSLLASTALAAWLGVEAIEANARQFCPSANEAWAKKRPEVFTIREGRVTTSGFTGVGLGFE